MVKNIKPIFILFLTGLPFLSFSQIKHGTTSPAGKTIKESISRGKLIYASNCLTCHQADGSGVPRMNPPLIKTKWVSGNKTTMIRQALTGSKGTVEIDGDKFSNTMPPFRQLSDEQIADVLTYIRNSFSNKAGAVTPSQVKMVRNTVK